MKNAKTILAAVAILIPAAVSCDKILQGPEGRIEISFNEELYLRTRAGGADLPDTNQFILNVTDSKGTLIYNGAYGAAPGSILAPGGTYTVTALSREFVSPEFDAPQWGDSQKVTVEGDRTSTVSLSCHQMNAGVRLKTSSDFLSAYPAGSLLLKSDNGKLLYGYTEKRFAYFLPGKVSLVLSDGGSDEVLLTRDLAARDMLTLNISVAKGAGSSSARNQSAGSITISVDTTLNRISEDFTIGGSSSSGKGGQNSAYGVSEARSRAGEKGVWVKGYIVGGDLSSSKASFTAPFKSTTNLVLAAKSSENKKEECLSVQLPKGAVRDALNLCDNPSNLGKEVLLKGNLVSAYYGIPGITDVSDFEFVQ